MRVLETVDQGCVEKIVYMVKNLSHLPVMVCTIVITEFFSAKIIGGITGHNLTLSSLLTHIVNDRHVVSEIGQKLNPYC